MLSLGIQKKTDKYFLWRMINISVLALSHANNFCLYTGQDLGIAPLSLSVPVQTHGHADPTEIIQVNVGGEVGTHLLDRSKTEMDQMAGVMRVKSKKENSPKMYQWHYCICRKTGGVKREQHGSWTSDRAAQSGTSLQDCVRVA